MKEVKEIFINELNKEQHKKAYEHVSQIVDLDNKIKELEAEILRLTDLKQEVIGGVLTGDNLTACGLQDKNVRVSFIPASQKVSGIDYNETFKGFDLDTIKKYKTNETIETGNNELIEKELKDSVKYKYTSRGNSIRVTPLVKGDE